MKKSVRRLACWFLLVMTLSSVFRGGADQPVVAAESYQSAIDKAKEEKAALEKKKKEISEKIASLEKDKKSTEDYIQKVDEELSAAYLEMTVIEANITECQKKLEETAKELADAIQTKDNQYAIMKARIKYMYENGEESFWEILTGANSLADFLNQVEYRSQIAKYDDSLLKRYEETCSRVEKKQEEYSYQLVVLEAEKDKQNVEIDRLNQLVINKAKYVEELAAALGISEETYFEYFEEIESKSIQIAELEEKERKRIEEEERKRKEEEERKKREEEERRKKEEEQKRREEELKKLGMTDNTSLDKMIWPFPTDHNIYSYYGNRTSPITGKKEFHSGIDIGGAYGANIVAALAGQVITAKWTAMNGYHIVIDHGNGVTTHYLHASQLLVGVGEYVKQGQVIMKCGSTGWSTAPHLHFTIRINNETVNPLNYITP